MDICHNKMSGGRLLVLDRQGRVVKHFPLPDGVATLGQDRECDIRVIQPAVSEHHASIVVFNKHALVHTVGESETLLNGQRVSKAVLRHNDVITVGDRSLRWEYTDPGVKRGFQVVGQYKIGRGGRNMRRRTVAPETSLRDRALRLAMEISRTSMPGIIEKQIAIVQPQRRDTGVQAEKTTPRLNTANKRPRNANNQMETSINESEADRSKRKSVKVSPKNSLPNIQNTTKATLWIESRKTSPRKSSKANTSVQGQKNSIQQSTSRESSVQGHVGQENSVQGHTSQDNSVQGHTSRDNSVQGHTSRKHSAQARSSPRKSVRVQTPAQIRIANVRKMFTSAKKTTPLRMAVLRKVQSAQKTRVTKIQAPSKIDHTKQAALLLMTGHTPKSKTSPKTKTPSYVVKKPSPVRKTPKSDRKSLGRRSKENNTPSVIVITPKRGSTYENNASKSVRSSGRKSVTILEITDSEADNTTRQSLRRSGQKSLLKSPLLPTPKKSALKDPKRNRKSESIKFDLSNLKTQETPDATKQTYNSSDSTSETEMTLHYSEITSSPSPRRSIHSRSSKILERTLGTTVTLSPPFDTSVKSQTLTPDSPSSRKSVRGSLILQKALDSPTRESSYSRRTSKTISETNQSEASSSLASAYKTHTLSSRSNRNDIESYSIVDLVSVDSNDDTLKSASSYNSVRSSSTLFGTPQNNAGRKTRSTIDNNFLGSSTPFYDIATRASDRSLSNSYSSSFRSRSSPNVSQTSKNSSLTTKSTVTTRRSKSLTTPENTHNNIPVNSTRISRRSRSRSRINDSELIFLDGEESDSSPKTSRRVTKTTENVISSLTENNDSPPQNEGTITPEERYSPQDVGTPVLRIQSLLNASQSSLTSSSCHKNSKRSYKRKTISVLSENRKRQSDYKSRSLNISAKKTLLRLSKDSSDDSVRTEEGAPQPDNEEVITPKSAVKLVPEAVKNKHSTAKKSLSKRSIIDDLNQSDIAKQLFNSPVKRKLSQSMTEFSRKRLFDEDDDVIIAKKPTRNTITLPSRTPDSSILEDTEAYTPERFVSPLNTPNNSPNLTGIKRLFKSNAPENDLSDVTGVNQLLRTPRPRRSVRNDLTNVSGVKSVFARSPNNSLNDLRIKNVFAKSPENDLRRVSGVKSLFREQNSPRNDLTDVRGVKRIFEKNSPANDLKNVSGVKRLQRNSPKNDLTDVRGVRKIFKQAKQSTSLNVSGVEELFNTSNQSYRDTDRVFDQLLGKPPVRAVYSNTFSTKMKHKPRSRQLKSLRRSIDIITNNVEEWLQNELQKRLNKDKANNSLTRELNRIATDTVEGTTPIRSSRVRDSTLIKTITGEVERKKSASEIYSARKLPIKKRSLIQKSLEESNNGEKSRLPIKKRLVAHSTPMKSWNSLTMNASELGRVSPIAFVNNSQEEHAKPTRLTKGQKGRRSKMATRKSELTKALLEEQTVLSNNVRTDEKSSPNIVNTKKNQNTKSINLNNTKKRQKSLVITKKVPTMTPRAKHSQSPMKQTNQQKRYTKLQTPKATRAKVHKGTVVVSKPSPVVKPAIKNNSQQEVSKVRATRSRKTVVDKSLKMSEKTRSPSNNSQQKSTEANVKKNPVKRGRKHNINEVEETETKGTTNNVVKNQEIILSNMTRQTRRNKTSSTVNSPKRLSAGLKTKKGSKTLQASKRQAIQTQKQTQYRNPKGNSRSVESVVTYPTEENLQNDNEQLRQVTSAVKTRNRTKNTIDQNIIKVNDNANAKRQLRRQKAISDVSRVESKKRNRRNKDITKLDVEVNDNTTSKGRKIPQKTISNESKMKVGARTRNRRNEEAIKSDSEINNNATGKRQKTLRKAISNESKTNIEPKTRYRRNKDAVSVDTEVNETKSRRKTRLNKAVSDEPKTGLQVKTQTRSRRNKGTIEMDNDNSKSRNQKTISDNTSEPRSKTKQLASGNLRERKRKIDTEEIIPAKMIRSKNKTIEIMGNSMNVRSKRGATNQSKTEDKSPSTTAMVTRKGRGGRVVTTAIENVKETTNKRKRKSKDLSSAQDTTQEPTSKKTRTNAEAAVTPIKSPLKTRSRRAKDANNAQTVVGRQTRKKDVIAKDGGQERKITSRRAKDSIERQGASNGHL